MSSNNYIEQYNRIVNELKREYSHSSMQMEPISQIQTRPRNSPSIYGSTQSFDTYSINVWFICKKVLNMNFSAGQYTNTATIAGIKSQLIEILSNRLFASVITGKLHSDIIYMINNYSDSITKIKIRMNIIKNKISTTVQFEWASRFLPADEKIDNDSTLKEKSVVKIPSKEKAVNALGELRNRVLSDTNRYLKGRVSINSCNISGDIKNSDNITINGSCVNTGSSKGGKGSITIIDGNDSITVTNDDTTNDDSDSDDSTPSNSESIFDGILQSVDTMRDQLMGGISRNASGPR